MTTYNPLKHRNEQTTFFQVGSLYLFIGGVAKLIDNHSTANQYATAKYIHTIQKNQIATVIDLYPVKSKNSSSVDKWCMIKILVAQSGAVGWMPGFDPMWNII